jgi:lipopolysaccharide biosynthesis glycosyltransferase
MATDTRFAVQTAVALRSLYSSNAGTEIDAIVLHDGIAHDVRDRVTRSIPDPSPSVRWLDRSSTDLRSVPTFHLSTAALFRLEIPELVPDADRVLYLDSDILVHAPLAPLWHIDLGPHAAGAVRSVNFPSIGTGGAVDRWRELGLSPRAPYFNSGVLLMDLTRWRSEGITGKVMQHIQSDHTTSSVPDQEALNVALCGQWTELAPRWNVQTPLLSDRGGGHLLYDEAVLEEARTNPAITHFIEEPKPWFRGCTHPRAGEWLRIANETAFAPVTLRRRPRTTPWRKRVKRAAAALLRDA